MGTQNRQRRRQKQVKRERAQRQHRSDKRTSPLGAGDSTPESPSIDLLIALAAEAAHHGRADAPELVGSLASGVPTSGATSPVARQVVATLEDEVAELRTKRWRPSELHRMARRKLGAGGAAIAAAAVLGEWLRHAGPDPDVEWTAEAAAFTGQEWDLDPDAPSWPDDLAAALSVLGLFAHLPLLPDTGAAAARPGRTARAAGGGQGKGARILDKVRGLLAKAESTTFPDEAAALTAKAQELLTRHSIDSAALDSFDRSTGATTASIRRLWIDDPYVNAKSHLLHVVATANRCRAVLSSELGLATVAGHDDDLDTVEILFTSLLVQATSQMTAVGSRTDSRGRSRTRSFRQSFLVAFATRIGQRLRQAEHAGESAAAERYGSAFLPVLASRATAADEAIEAIFSGLVKRSTSATNLEGWVRGTAAADRATLLSSSELGPQPGLEGSPAAAG